MTTTPDAPDATDPRPHSLVPGPDPAAVIVDPVAESGDDEGSRVSRWAAAIWVRLGAVTVESWITVGIVVACIAFIGNQIGFAVGLKVGFPFIDLHDNLILRETTPAGGDMGAHVWGPAYLRDELLPRWRLTGWTQDWYAGFPAYHFYMIVPSLLIALLSYIIPYGIAFKLVAISGIVTLPISAWAFGRLARLPFPAPPLLAVGATAFLFDQSFSIYGGNIASTLAGEFAFSISLSLALLYLGVLCRGLETGKHAALAAVLLALVGLSHLIPAFFAIAATVVALAFHPGSSSTWRRPARVLLALAGAAGAILAVTHLLPALGVTEQPAIAGAAVAACWMAVAAGSVGWIVLGTGAGRWRWLIPMGVVGAALSAFWVLPFYMQSRYLNDMGWEKKDGCYYTTFLFNRGTEEAGCSLDSGLVDSLPLRWVLAVAAIGLLLSVINRRRGGGILATVAVVAGIAFWAVPDARLWNARITPFYYLCLYLLAAVGVAELGRLLAALVAPDVRRPVRAVMWGTALAGLGVVLIALGLPLHSLPGGSLAADGVTYRWGPLATTENSFVDSWATWNFTGYEGKPAWPEYHDIVATMDDLGATNGCGRAMWEHEEQHDRYGTPMALMLLPFWTKGCIGSMEGLFFEASATTPYHFLNQDQLSSSPSNAQRDLPYDPGPPRQEDFDLGIDHLQLLGVRYYMAISERMQGFADAHPDLAFVASSGPWKVYEVTDAPSVASLTNLPVVVEGADAGHGTWQELAVRWFEDPSAWSVPLADDGPDDWPRTTLAALEDGEPVAVNPVDPVVVSDIATDEDSIAFTVDRPGVPVVVKTSYFPNWQASGADGPWRIAPNLMVVVPTSTSVELSYGYTSIDLGAMLLTALGLVGLIWLKRSGPVDLRASPSFWDARPDLPTPPDAELGPWALEIDAGARPASELTDDAAWRPAGPEPQIAVADDGAVPSDAASTDGDVESP